MVQLTELFGQFDGLDAGLVDAPGELDGAVVGAAGEVLVTAGLPQHVPGARAQQRQLTLHTRVRRQPRRDVPLAWKTRATH